MTVVVLTTEGSNRQQYESLLGELKVNKVLILDEYIYDTINFRAFTAELNDCDVGKLLGNPIISTPSLNAQGTAKSSSGGGATLRIRDDDSSAVVLDRTASKARIMTQSDNINC